MKQSEEIHFKQKGLLKPPRHRRLKVEPSKLKRLADNMALNGIQNPIVCLPDLEIISGDRRWSAAMSDERIEIVPVRIITDPLSDKEIRILRISENLHREDITAYERFLECQAFREAEPDITAKAMAELLSVDPSMITRYLSPADCIEEVRKALKEELLGIKQVYEFSKESPERQEELLAKALKKPAGIVPGAKKPGKFEFPMSSGIVVTLRGVDKPLSIDDAIHELSKALAELKAGKRLNDTPKSFMERCNNRVKAGGDGPPIADDSEIFEVPHV